MKAFLVHKKKRKIKVDMKDHHGQKSCPFPFLQDMDKKVFRWFKIRWIKINIQNFFQLFVYKNILKRLLSLTAANFLQNIIWIELNLFSVKI